MTGGALGERHAGNYESTQLLDQPYFGSPVAIRAALAAGPPFTRASTARARAPRLHSGDLAAGGRGPSGHVICD